MVKPLISIYGGYEKEIHEHSNLNIYTEDGKIHIEKVSTNQSLKSIDEIDKLHREITNRISGYYRDKPLKLDNLLKRGIYESVLNQRIIIDLDSKTIKTTYNGEIPIFIRLDDDTLKLYDYRCFNSHYLYPNKKYHLHRDTLKMSSYRYPSLNYKLDINASAKLLIEGLDYILTEILENIRNKRIYLSFSGGIDSSLLLKLLVEKGYDIRVITIGVKESTDLKEAEKIAYSLGFRGDHITLEVKDIEEAYSYVVNKLNIENRILKAVGISEYHTFRYARGEALILGQGADELFGGYDKYRRRYDDFEWENRLDLIFLGITTTYVEWMLSKDMEVKTFYPYLNMLNWIISQSIPIELKVRGEDDIYRKWVIREALKILKAPKEIYMRRKKAMQYSTGLSKIIKKYESKS